jgi:hypothetical protein
LDVLPSDVPYKIDPIIQTWSMDNGVLRLGIQVKGLFTQYNRCRMTLHKIGLILYFACRVVRHRRLLQHEINFLSVGLNSKSTFMCQQLKSIFDKLTKFKATYISEGS